MAMGHHPTAEMLESIYEGDRLVEIEGVTFRMTGERGAALNIGDTYVAGRNTEPKLLTVRGFDGGIGGWVYSEEENVYPFDLWECYRVELAE